MSRPGIPIPSFGCTRAGSYDTEQSLPAAVMSRLISLLLEHLPAEGLCLDVGAGTGLLAIPLQEAGRRVVAVDRSPDMLNRLAAKSGGRIPVVAADARSLPLRSASCAAGIVRRVLHLVPAWQTAVREICRVTQPGGTLLVEALGPDSLAPSIPWQEVWDRFRDELGHRERPGLRSLTELDAFMTSLGASVAMLPRLVERHRATIPRTIDALARREIDRGANADLVMRAAQQTRAWAAERYGPADRPYRVERIATWHAYILPPHASGEGGTA
jgi:ubiquinone/menaquinone biosynthesis C-methylase UbiE